MPLVGGGGDEEPLVAGKAARRGPLKLDPAEGEASLEVEVVDPAKLGEGLGDVSLPEEGGASALNVEEQFVGMGAIHGGAHDVTVDLLAVLPEDVCVVAILYLSGTDSQISVLSRIRFLYQT